jgi:hypothetical protein
MVRLVERPTFARKKELARYVSEGDRLGGNRTALTAFIDPPAADPAKEYLSVNSLEVEKVTAIAEYYRQAFQGGVGDVSICTRTLEDYTDAGKKSDVQLLYDKPSGSWQFIGKSLRAEPAYTHRAVVKRPDGLKSPSHCGVDFVRMMNEHQRSKFARRLSGRRYHKYK